MPRQKASRFRRLYRLNGTSSDGKGPCDPGKQHGDLLFSVQTSMNKINYYLSIHQNNKLLLSQEINTSITNVHNSLLVRAFVKSLDRETLTTGVKFL